MTTRSSSTTSGGNVGQGEYVVEPGDCIESIAAAAGLFWETVWNDPRNCELREKRKDPNILLPGDRVSFDAVRPKHEDATTGMCHRFMHKGVPSVLKLQVLDLDNYRDDNEGIAYHLEVEERWFQGVTDREGNILQTILPNAQKGRLILAPGTPFETKYDLDLGQLDPVNELAGICARLENLGFDVGDAKDEEELHDALAAFQESHDLEQTGKLDDETRSLIEETYGS